MINRYLRSALLLLSFLLTASPAKAGKIIDYIRNYDLNDYSLGVAVSVSQSPYVGADNSVIPYPILTSFEHADLNKDWLVLKDGDLGFRYINKSAWEFGVLGRVNTLSIGPDRPPELSGLHDREWAVEVGPYIGYRGWPIQPKLKIFNEVTGRHGGLATEFELSLPRQHDWGYIVPLVKVSYLESSYADYYYGVTPDESRPGRPAYEPGASTNVIAQIQTGYQISEQWLISGKVGYQWLDDSITASPIVDVSGTWFGNVSVAYNANVFRPRTYAADQNRKPKYEFRIGVQADNVKTTVRRDNPNGTPGDPVDLEDDTGASGQENVGLFEALWRITPYQNLEFGSFTTDRHATTTLQNDFVLGEEVFTAGTEVDLKTKLRITRLAYGYSLMSDAQKELGVSLGLHVADFTVDMTTDTQNEQSNATAPMPVFGAYGSLHISEKTYLMARLQFFRMRFEDFKGSMNYFYIAAQRKFGENFSGGLGYSFYKTRLKSDGANFSGTLDTTHHGPSLYLSAHF